MSNSIEPVLNDPYFRVKVLSKTPDPQQLIWVSAHQCVSSEPAIGAVVPPEDKAGEYVVKHLLAGDRGHYSPLEAPQISFNVIGFNHRTMQQITRHRIGWHFSVQSFRYTSEHFLETAYVIRNACDRQHHPKSEAISKAVMDCHHVQEAIETVIYLRPEGRYTDRSGHRYYYDASERLSDLTVCAGMILRYAAKIEAGYSEEHAAGLLPMDSRQHWVMSANPRSLMHLLDLRTGKGAEIEAQALCELIFPHFREWCPSLAEWYYKHRWAKARLAP